MRSWNCSPATPGLAAREREVVTLIAQGKSNRAIAAALVIEIKTVEAHTTHILTKLGFSSRAQIAAWALALLRALATTPVKLITSNYVFAESVTVISQRVAHQAALAFIREIKSPQSLFTVQWITEDLEALAVQIFTEQTSKNVSFVDCTNMALVDHDHIDYIFSFDGIYTKSGYRLVQELVEP